MTPLSLSAALITGLMIQDPRTLVRMFLFLPPAKIHESVCGSHGDLKNMHISVFRHSVVRGGGGGVDLHNTTIQTHIHTAARVQGETLSRLKTKPDVLQDTSG